MFQQVHGIILFGPIIAAFHAGDENFKTFHITRIVRHRLGQRRNFNRMPENQRRLNQILFDQFKRLHQRLADARLRFVHADAAPDGDSLRRPI